MNPVLRVGLVIVLVGLAIAVGVKYWPDHADPRSSDMHQRLLAVDELVGSNGQEALDTLSELTSDAEQRVCIAAIRALGSRTDEASRLKLKQIASKSASGVLRGIAAAELGNFKKTDCHFLTDILLKDKAPEARAGAAVGLKRLRDPHALSSLVKALSDPDVDTRRSAYGAIWTTTGRFFKFDPAASPESRAQCIAWLKKELARVKSPHDH
ncbi:MAG: HEAT repeat domain-containing protein [Phycisphaerae bacterium]|jgi:HEAT repeat protein|nr:HEAT repeat domain-containing protein [Phycisphaerae bacterium]